MIRIFVGLFRNKERHAADPVPSVPLKVRVLLARKAVQNQPFPLTPLFPLRSPLIDSFEQTPSVFSLYVADLPLLQQVN